MDLLKYLAVPYADRGRDLAGWDCYGLYRYVLKAEFGKVVGSFAETYRSDDTPAGDASISAVLRTGERRGWQRVDNEQPGDGVVFLLGGQPIHCGLVITPGTMLHCMRGRQTCVERYDSIAWKKRIEGKYRWTS